MLTLLFFIGVAAGLAVLCWHYPRARWPVGIVVALCTAPLWLGFALHLLGLGLVLALIGGTVILVFWACMNIIRTSQPMGGGGSAMDVPQAPQQQSKDRGRRRPA
jgi:hypothetical protein